MLSQRLRRSPSISPALVQRLVLAGMTYVFAVDVNSLKGTWDILISGDNIEINTAISQA